MKRNTDALLAAIDYTHSVGQILVENLRDSVCVLLITIGIAAFIYPPCALGQVRGNTLFGDVKVDESRAEGRKPLSLSIILYTLGGNVVGRQTVPSGGRYRFNNIPPGEYDLAVEVETNEIARIHVALGGAPGSDFRQDLEFEWKPSARDSRPRPAAISTTDVYQRSSTNESLFRKGQAAVDSKKYDEAITLFRQVLGTDNHDFQAWTELGTAYLMSDKKGEAEKAYVQAADARPNFDLALLNLGRVRLGQKKYEEAIATLMRLVELEPESADGNLLLGEGYLQMKKGSKAVPYLNEAARLGRPEAHLRLATLYDAAGLKDRAANEYEEYLKKKPDDSSRKKLEKYIADNKKQ